MWNFEKWPGDPDMLPFRFCILFQWPSIFGVWDCLADI